MDRFAGRQFIIIIIIWAKTNEWMNESLWRHQKMLFDVKASQNINKMEKSEMRSRKGKLHGRESRRENEEIKSRAENIFSAFGEWWKTISVIALKFISVFLGLWTGKSQEEDLKNGDCHQIRKHRVGMWEINWSGSICERHKICFMIRNILDKRSSAETSLLAPLSGRCIRR